MIELSVKGADDFLRLSKALKAAGEKEMRKELHKGMRDTVNKVKPKAAEALAAALPNALASKGLAVKQAVQVKTGANPGVSVVVRYGSSGRGLSAKNARLVNASGRFRHPVFGRDEWVAQAAKSSGWFDKTYMNAAPRLRAELIKVLESVADQIVRKAR